MAHGIGYFVSGLRVVLFHVMPGRIRGVFFLRDFRFLSTVVVPQPKAGGVVLKRVLVFLLYFWLGSLVVGLSGQGPSCSWTKEM